MTSGSKWQDGGSKFHDRRIVKPDCRQKRSVPVPPTYGIGGLPCKRDGFIRCSIGPMSNWNREQNWRKVEAASEKEAAEKVCGLFDRGRPACATSRPRPQIRRSQSAKRDAILCGRVGHCRARPPRQLNCE